MTGLISFIIQRTIPKDTRPFVVIGKLRNRAPEILNKVVGKERADHLVSGYQTAFGKDWQIWMRPVQTN
jgi:hypothetical protein